MLRSAVFLTYNNIMLRNENYRNSAAPFDFTRFPALVILLLLLLLLFYCIIIIVIAGELMRRRMGPVPN